MYKKYRKPKASIQVTPIVDVFLVLLVIFIIAPAAMTGIDVSVPNGTNEIQADTVSKKYINVSYRNKYKIYINNNISSLEDIVENINTISKKNYYYDIFMHGDRGANYGEIMSLIEILNNAGYKRVILVTNNGNE